MITKKRYLIKVYRGVIHVSIFWRYNISNSIKSHTDRMSSSSTSKPFSLATVALLPESIWTMYSSYFCRSFLSTQYTQPRLALPLHSSEFPSLESPLKFAPANKPHLSVFVFLVTGIGCKVHHNQQHNQY